METAHCDALVFFGITGDRRTKKSSLSLQAMVQRGTSRCRSSAWPGPDGTWISSGRERAIAWYNMVDSMPTRGVRHLVWFAALC